MRRLVRSLLLSCTLAASGAFAAPTLLGSVGKDYGSAPSRSAPASFGAGSCDALSSGSVRITDQSGCQRFHDVFDFSSIAFDQVDRFELTLTYANTSGGFFGPLNENWAVRPAQSASVGSNDTFLFLGQVGSGGTTATFSIDGGADVFAGIVGGQRFYLWFSEFTLGSDAFDLSRAVLSVYGTAPTAIPESDALSLLGVGLLGLGLSTRLRRSASRRSTLR